MVVQELWSEDDERRQQALCAAVDVDNLLGAMQAVEGADARARAFEEVTLARLANRARSLSSGDARSEAETLRRVLVDEEGLSGDRDDYDAVENSHLGRVLERRRGLPILLSLVWMEVGRRAGMRVDGIGMPVHFLARVGGSAGVFVDPFGGGRVLEPADCQALLAKLSGGRVRWSDGFLSPTPTRAIFERVLRNLTNAYEKRDDLVGVFRMASFWSALRPDLAPAQLQKAVVAEKLGAAKLASELYAAIAREFPGTEEGRIAAERVGEGRPPLLH